MITYSAETIGYINLFERVTNAHVKDCFLEEDKLVFIIGTGDIGKAIGKNGANVKQISYAVKKPIKLIEYNENPAEFLKNLLAPIRPQAIRLDGESLIVKTRDAHEKGQIYGREKTNLKKVQAVLNKYFPYKITIE